jgi:8-oxo-dGTP diphosphatase
VPGLARRVAAALPVYARTAWWGILAPRLVESAPLVVDQAVALSPRGVLLAVRSDLRGWELPGGTPLPGESGEQAVRREVLEETGVEVAVERLVGEYRRTGFRPHTARVWLCRARGGEARPSPETPAVAWFPADALPGTLFPWYRQPLADARAGLREPVRRGEHWGAAAVLAGLWIDLRMRASDDRAR